MTICISLSNFYRKYGLGDNTIKIRNIITEVLNTYIKKNQKMKKTLIRLTESDLCYIVKNCFNEVLLIENRESKSKPPRFMLNNTPNYIS